MLFLKSTQNSSETSSELQNIAHLVVVERTKESSLTETEHKVFILRQRL